MADTERKGILGTGKSMAMSSEVRGWWCTECAGQRKGAEKVGGSPI